MYGYFLCMNIYVPSAWGGQKREKDLLALELQIAVGNHVGTGN